MAAVESTNPMAVPTGLTAVSRITSSPAAVPSVMITPSGAPTLRIRLCSGGPSERGCCGVPANDTTAS